LENVISAQDYKRILTVIDNSEKSSVSDCGLQPSINSVKENIKFINQQIISIYSLQGGVGKTTIAFNLAFYLKNMINVKILVVDLNFAEGQSDMPIAIGLTEAPNLGSYVEKITEDYDAFLDSILSLKGLNIDLIQPPVSIFQSDKFSVDMLDNLIYYARNEYNFIIADIPYRYDNICLEMLNLSTMLIFVMFPGPGAATRIRNLQKLLQGNQKKGIVINNVFGTNNFYLEEFIDDLGIPTLARIPFISEDEKDFIRIGKFRTDILNMQQEMVELVKKVI
jgi:cellulose biosynthesis protein BcsQ